MMEIKSKKCAVYTRKSTDEGLEREFNSLEAQREACENYIASQRGNHWICLAQHYDDGGYSGGNMERPALKRLLQDIEYGLVDIVVVYRYDRLSRSLCDFSMLQAFFEEHHASFASVTQELNSTTSGGRLMLNILMTFAQFEREITVERVTDKMHAARRRGQYIGGPPPLGYEVVERKLKIVDDEANKVLHIFQRFQKLKDTYTLMDELNDAKYYVRSSKPWDRARLLRLLTNRQYIGEIDFQGEIIASQVPGFVPRKLWDNTQSLISNTTNKTKISYHKQELPLRNLVHCGHCKSRMVPTYANKGDQRYHYYYCRKDSQQQNKRCPARRISSTTLENFVLNQVIVLLKQPQYRDVLCSGMGDEFANLILSHLSSADLLEWLLTEDLHKLFLLFVEDITIEEKRVQVVLKTMYHSELPYKKIFSGVSAELLPVGHLKLTHEIQQRRWHSRKVLGSPESVFYDLPLQQTLARVFRWQELFDSGKIRDVNTLSKLTGMNEGLIRRLLRLTTLDPYIIGAILDGRYLADFSISKYNKCRSSLWHEQRMYFKISKEVE